MSKLKLNVLLAKTDVLGAQYKNMVKDFGKFFSTKQGAFKGMKRTYTPKEGMIDDPSKRGNDLVTSTVSEKLAWFQENAEEYINALFSQEATNAAGNAKAVLVVDGHEMGEFSSLELLRLKGIIESNDVYNMLSNIPVRSDSREWEDCTAEQYAKRDIVQSPALSGTTKTTEKESYILPDPNIKGKDLNGYTPQVAVKTTQIDVADYTVQEFSGEMSHRERAEILQRRTKLIAAVIVALKQCNDVEAVQSDLTSAKIFGYLFEG